jgi:hypothetical protein
VIVHGDREIVHKVIWPILNDFPGILLLFWNVSKKGDSEVLLAI